MKRKPKTSAKTRKVVDHKLYEVTPSRGKGKPRLTQVRPSAVIEIDDNILRVTLDKPNPRLLYGALHLGRTELHNRVSSINSQGLLVVRIKSSGRGLNGLIEGDIRTALMARVAETVEGALQVYGYTTIVQPAD